MNQSNLKELLNDDSFIRWLNEKAMIGEQQRWDRWLAENPARQKIVEKAGKIATVPFKREIPKNNIEQELRILKKEIKKVEEKSKK